MALKLYVIDLSQFARRHESAVTQLDRLGGSYEAFRAIEGCDSDDFFESIDERRYVLNTGRAPSDGEIGRYASHLYLWNLCGALDEPIVILEDDVEIDVSFLAALDAVHGAIRRCGFVGLHGEGPETRPRSVARLREFTLSECRQYPLGAMCYVVAPRVARIFVQASQIVTGSVDAFIGRYWSHGQPLYLLSPTVVRSGGLVDSSEFAKRSDAPLRAPTRADRVVASTRSMLERLVFDLRHGGRR